MASVFSHIVVPLAIMAGSGRIRHNQRLLVVAMICAALPDLDVIAFKFGIDYSSAWGHRGFTHSAVFALLLAGVLAACDRSLRASRGFIFWLIFISTVSHPILDALTNGGLGVALLWPFSQERYFLPWQVIEVSPIGIARFFSERGLEVMRSEVVWIWLPAAVLALALWSTRRWINRKVNT